MPPWTWVPSGALTRQVLADGSSGRGRLPGVVRLLDRFERPAVGLVDVAGVVFVQLNLDGISQRRPVGQAPQPLDGVPVRVGVDFVVQVVLVDLQLGGDDVDAVGDAEDKFVGLRSVVPG